MDNPMDVGRELDARIAETVFGWQWYIADNVQYLRSPYPFAYGCVIDSDGTHYLKVLPRYSTDIAAAWLVVEELQARGVWLEELSGRYETSYRAGFSWRDPERGVLYRQAMADTAPLAICRAALEALHG